MKKNVASQKIGCQMCATADGSAFTGTVTVYVTGDAGTQAIGTVGSGVCTHEGNGYHTYLPSQAETNFDLAAFTFIGTLAIPSTVQIYTIPTTGLMADVIAINSDATSAANLSRSAGTIVSCTVGAASSTTSIITSACSPSGSVADQFKGRIVIFLKDTTTAALRGQATNITASSNSATPVLTVSALSTAPVSGDTFVIV